VEETIVASRREGNRRSADIEADVVLSVISDGIVVHDSEGRVVRLNDAAASLFGLADTPLIEPIDPLDLHIVHPDGSEWPRGSWPVDRVLADGIEVRDEIMGVDRGDGTVDWVKVTSSPALLDAEGHVTRVVTAFSRTAEPVGRHGLPTQQDPVFRDAEAQSDRWRRFLNELPEMSVLEVEEGDDGLYRYVAAMGRALSKRGYPNIIGSTVSETSSGQNRGEIMAAFKAAFAGHAQRRTIRHPDGWWLDGTIIPIGQVNSRPRVMVVFRDVTREREREHALTLAEERYRRMFSEAPSGHLVYDVAGNILAVNRAFCSLVGCTEEELVGCNAAEVSEKLSVDVRSVMSAAQITEESGRASGDLSLVRRDGSVAHVTFESVALLSSGDEVEEFLVHVTDVTDRHLIEEHAAHMADHDALTDLYNRRRFEQELSGHMARGERYGHRGALLLLDLDDFKRVNDTLGHKAGDELILNVANVLREQLRDTDVISRLGGDEFAVLLPSGGREAAEQLATKLVEAIRAEVSVTDGNRSRRVTASLGVVLINKQGLTAMELLKQADLAMYDTKEAGRDGYTLLDLTESGRSKSAAHTVWADRIEAALEENRFILHAQPIVDLRTGVVESAELLVRMLDEDGTLVPPSRFLYVAERIGLVTRIDEWVVGEAVKLLKELQPKAPTFRLEVNLSGRSMGSTQLSEHIRSTVSKAGIDPSGLVFEVTETAAVSDIQSARTFAEELRRVGCRFALDDFGAGFGSFYYLKHLPFDFLKIDGEFVVKCASSPTDQLILTAIVEIARGMEKETIAEFVGDQITLDTIRRTGVDHAQGYFIGSPMPLDELVPMAILPLI
jgi:diguanylate cyclase (GGDEF)-like protein/PAS domain S-box-containing protein